MSSQEDHEQSELLPETAVVNKPKGFWYKEFARTITSDQVGFDVVFGALAPILALLFDPIVFRSTDCWGGPLFGRYAVFAYVAIPQGIISLFIWLFFNRSLKTGTGIIAGILLAGAVFAIGLGVLLVPFSILGLLVCLGIFGFTPFITGFVYLRNAVRALHRERQRVPQRSWLQLAALMLLGALLVVGPPALAQHQVTMHATNPISQALLNFTSNSSSYNCGSAQ